MNYLFGDSTASKLTSNFLEFLRDALDFAVFVLQADTRMREGRVQIRELGQAADAESERLERFIASVSRAVHGGEKGAPDSPTAQCAGRLSALIVDAHRSSIDGIRQTLTEAIARIEAEEVASRDACVKALGTLLAPHDPPNTETTLQLVLGDSGRYKASLDAKSEPSLAWMLEVAIPDGHAWSSLMRVDRLVPHLEIRTPQLAGWLTKEVKIRPQKLERYVITKVVHDGKTLAFEVRTESSHDVGFNFEISLAQGTVKATRVGPTDDASVGAFEPQSDDMPLLVDIATKIQTSLAGFERRPNIGAMFEGTDFRKLPSYHDFIDTFMETMGPIVREIAQRSLTPNELVLRRPLGNDRREEIFVSKATLREKIAVLPAQSRVLFSPLGLDGSSSAEPRRTAASPASERTPIRSELPPSPSRPPPGASLASPTGAPPSAKPRSAPPPLSALAAGLPSSPPNAVAPVSTFTPIRSAPPPANAALGARTLQPPQGAPPPAQAIPAKMGSAVPPPKELKLELGDAPQIEVIEEEDDVEMSSDHLETIPEVSQSLVTSDGSPRNESLVAALKKIVTLSKNGRSVEAYKEYERLFANAEFAAMREEEQRQALKLMVLAKSHPTDDTEAVASAHRAALVRLKALVDRSADPQDQELLGVTHLFLGDEKAATAAFQAGLDVERVRNPQSDLIATLMRRVSQI